MYENFVLPKTYWIGATAIKIDDLMQYLEDTDQLEFRQDMSKARSEGMSDGEILCSFYAKLCYASLTTKKNDNISKIRSISDNLDSIIDTAHGSVIEHCSLNFVVTNCSRVFTHELVRHRVGTAFSQTSGRYVRSDVLNIVYDPILFPIKELCEDWRHMNEQFYNRAVKELNLNEMKSFDAKKKMTSALRRFLPNGQANEIGVTLNLRTLRHTIETRTSRHAEWEIRVVFNQIADAIFEKYPAMFGDASAVIVDCLREITFKNKKI